MSDIFISYSSKDREKAEQLTELLASAGLSVWIDQSGLDVSTSWSAEIVDAINNCHAFIVLLSPNSIESHNVIKEVSLASEKRKKILPLDLEPITLPRELEYQLAGIHRAPMTNIDSIIRALGKLGLEATQAPTLKLVKETDSRKSLMILPFEDLSPTADNEWFANGIVSELINVLGNVKALKVMDAATTKEYKSYKGHLTNYAKEMGIRYFVQGDVRKFGDQIKISSRLLDIETSDHLWQDSLRGTMLDIFDIQEMVAKNVVEGLKIILTPEEEQKIEDKITENAEAFELFLKASEYFSRHTKPDYERSRSLLEEAVLLDPKFVKAYANLAIVANQIYAFYDRDPHVLDLASKALEAVKNIEGETWSYYHGLSSIALLRTEFEEAIRFARKAIELNPNGKLAYDALAKGLNEVGEYEEGTWAFEQAVRLNDKELTAHFNLLTNLQEKADTQRLNSAAEKAIPIYERHLRLNPDDYNTYVQLATIWAMIGSTQQALIAASRIPKIELLDGQTLYNLACLYMLCDDPRQAMHCLRQSFAKGFNAIHIFRSDPDLATLRGTPEFEELMKELEEKIAEEKNV